MGRKKEKLKYRDTTENWDWCVTREITVDQLYLLHKWGQAYLNNNINSSGV